MSIEIHRFTVVGGGIGSLAMMGNKLFTQLQWKIIDAFVCKRSEKDLNEYLNSLDKGEWKVVYIRAPSLSYDDHLILVQVVND